MLPRSARLTQSDRFRLAVRRGTRTGSRALVLHWLPTDEGDTAQVGFVVSKAVGNAVVRNRVKRQLRHLTREHLTELPGRGVLVVRANPSAAQVSRVELERDLVRGLGRLGPRGE